MVSQYNLRPEEQYPIRNLMQIVSKRIKMQGFIVGDANMGPKYYAEHQKNLQKWIADGSFKVQQSVTVGIDNAIDGFLGMLKGENFGKAVLQIADLEKDNVGAWVLLRVGVIRFVIERISWLSYWGCARIEDILICLTKTVRHASSKGSYYGVVI